MSEMAHITNPHLDFGIGHTLRAVMQASWGAETHAAINPTRTGLLYGEAGSWYVGNTLSCPDVFTRADPGVRGADNAEEKFTKKEYVATEMTSQAFTNKYTAEQDIQAIGLHAGTFASPDKMTMADHDMGLAWPPPKGEEGLHAKFMGMVKESSPYKDEVQGIMVGYKGHVPRSRDKIGGCALGGIVNGRTAEGFPSPEATAAAYLPGFGAQTRTGSPGKKMYVSNARAHEAVTIIAAAGSPPPNRPTNTVSGDGFIPRYAGHMPKVFDHVGESNYGAVPEGQKYIAPSNFKYKTVQGDIAYDAGRRSIHGLSIYDKLI